MTPTDTTFPDVYQDFDAQRQQLARRRRLAEQLLQTRNDTTARFAPNGSALFGGGPGQTLANGVDAMRGMFENQNLDVEERDLAAQEAKQANDLLNSIPRSGPERQAALLSAGNKFPSLRNSISALLAADERKQIADDNRLEKSEQEAANRVEKANSEERYRRTFEQSMALKQAPTVHITNSTGAGANFKVPAGYMLNATGDGVVPIPGSDKDPATNRPTKLNPKQLETQRAYVDLEKSLNEYDKLLNDYDPRGGSAASPATRAAIEAAHTDVMMKLKDLYQMGAPQQGDLMMLERGLDSPVTLSGTVKGATFGTDPFKAKSKQLRTLLNNSRDSFDVQFNTKSPRHEPTSPAPSAGAPSAGAPARINSDAEFDRLPSGATFVDPEGNVRRKP